MTQATERFVDDLVAAFPGLRPAFDEHLSDNFGEVLPHVFFGDLTRYVLARYRAARSEPESQRSQAQGEVRALLNELEDAYTSRGDEVQELIAVSFLENLPRPGDDGAEIGEWLGPAMTDQLRVIG
jgi:hypothetical protein